MADYKNQAQISQQILEDIKAYNVDIDTNKTGTYVAVITNAVSDIGLSVYDFMEQVKLGNSIDTASQFMLETMASSLSLNPRNTGSFAHGTVTITLSSGTSSLTIPKNTKFYIGSFDYYTDKDYTVDSTNTSITIVAYEVGAEYNLRAGVSLAYDMSGISSAISNLIGGGNGIESIGELRNRIRTNIRFRKTSAMLTDYTQYCLEFFNYAVSSTIFVDSVVPVGVNCNVINTINDYELASSNDEINEIECSTEQLTDLKNNLKEYKVAGTSVDTSTQTTQVVSSLSVTYTAPNALSTLDTTIVKQKIRKSLLEYRKDKLYADALSPEIDDYVTSFFVDSFTPIDRTSYIMDILLSNITLTYNGE